LLDLVIWDSHPLALGATPSQVFIDGIAQLEFPYIITKPENFQKSPRVPNFDDEARKAVTFEGLPPLVPKKMPLDNTVVFKNVKSIHVVKKGIVEQMYFARAATEFATVVSHNGSIACYGDENKCMSSKILGDPNVFIIDLEGGSLSPGLVTYGSPVGLQHIDQEASTNDGNVYDPLRKAMPDILGGDSAIIRAADGLQFASRDALYVSSILHDTCNLFEHGL
jgi:hypothetical protein